MDAKYYLQSVEALKQAMITAKEMYEDAIDIKGVDYSAYKPGSNAQINTSVDTVVERSEKLYEEYMNCYERYFERYTEACNVIRSVKTSKYSSLLFKRFIQGKSWEEIATELERNSSYISGPWQSKALKEFEEAYKEYKKK